MAALEARLRVMTLAFRTLEESGGSGGEEGCGLLQEKCRWEAGSLEMARPLCGGGKKKKACLRQRCWAGKRGGPRKSVEGKAAGLGGVLAPCLNCCFACPHLAHGSPLPSPSQGP